MQESHNFQIWVADL